MGVVESQALNNHKLRNDIQIARNHERAEIEQEYQITSRPFQLGKYIATGTGRHELHKDNHQGDFERICDIRFRA